MKNILSEWESYTQIISFSFYQLGKAFLCLYGKALCLTRQVEEVVAGIRFGYNGRKRGTSLFTTAKTHVGQWRCKIVRCAVLVDFFLNLFSDFFQIFLDFLLKHFGFIQTTHVGQWRCKIVTMHSCVKLENCAKDKNSKWWYDVVGDPDPSPTLLLLVEQSCRHIYEPPHYLLLLLIAELI